MFAMPMLAAVLMTQPQDSRYTKDLLAVGTTAPTFDIDGTSGKVSFKGAGNVVSILVFWHVGSRSSLPLMSDMEALEGRYPKQAKVIFVNSGDDKDRVTDFLKSNGLSHPSALSAPTDVVAAYGVKGFPTVYVVDKVGKIVFRDHQPSTSDVDAAVKKAVSEPGLN